MRDMLRRLNVDGWLHTFQDISVDEVIQFTQKRDVLTYRAVCKATNYIHPFGFLTAKLTPWGN